MKGHKDRQKNIVHLKANIYYKIFPTKDVQIGPTDLYSSIDI